MVVLKHFGVNVHIFGGFFLFLLWSCGGGAPTEVEDTPPPALRTGAAQTELYLPQLQGKRVGLLVNQTSRIGEQHLVDTLHALGIDITRIFAPEHGFRGEADAGAQIADGRDATTGAPLISLYGDKKKPGPDDLAGLDVVVFDIQDVGARFYTYISTMSYVMEACAENDVPFMVLDRPNPNGHYVDGPVLDPAYSSFVGMHPVPVVHGMTVGEYARMVNGEGWLKNGVQCDLTIIPCANYTHDTPYELPVKPSPNLPNMRAIYLYPSLCFLEPTVASVGRGTNLQFQVVGIPGGSKGDYEFTPEPRPGAQYPKHEGKLCRGYNLTRDDAEDVRRRAKLDLVYLLQMYQAAPDPDAFFTSPAFFDKLAGGPELREMIERGMSGPAIRMTWQEEVEAFRQKRQPYLLYP